MRSTRAVVALLALLIAAPGCSNTEANPSGDGGKSGPFAFLTGNAGPKVPAGTNLGVKLSTEISSETASSGDAWTGVTTGNVIVDEKVVIPAGSEVHGVVSAAKEAKKGDRAMLTLEVRKVVANGKSSSFEAGSEPVIAGSPRARNLGAIAGGAAAGALIGKAVGGDGKDAAIGGIIGGAAAGAGVAASKGYQVVLKAGTVMHFTLRNETAVKS